MSLKQLGLIALLLLASRAALAASSPDDPDWHRLVGILQYVEADYPAAIESGSAFELDEQRAFIAEALASAQRLSAAAAPFLPRLESVRARIEKQEDAPGVSRDCAALVDDIVKSTGMVRAPTRAPDLATGQRVYEARCAACHGVDGAANTPIAATLTPRPVSFVDAEVMNGLSPYRAFNTTTFGVPGTPMVSFKDTLSSDERWATAFYLFTLRQAQCTKSPASPSPSLTLAALATSTDAELAARGVDLPCARRAVAPADEGQAIAATLRAVDDALLAVRAGDRARASRTLIDAYLQHIEPIEPKLAGRDPDGVVALEQAFWDLRAAIERGSADEVERAERLSSLLHKLEAKDDVATRGSAFWMALLIILREGFEAMVVVVALLAALKTMGRHSYARVVHLGWVSALIAGAVAFFLGQRLLAGARREWLEGIVALVAVVMLVYAATWLSARTHMRRYMGELREKISTNLDRGSIAGLFLLSFTAAGRETFETALFLQGIGIDAPMEAAWGAAAGIAILAALVFVIMRVGYRLPMQLLFKASTALLCVTAVILLGKGLHALQEVGAIGIHPAPIPRIDLVGIYPDALTLGAQGLLSVALIVWAYSRRLRATS